MSPETAKSRETRTKLLEGALRTLTEQGIARTSARTVAASAGVNQALVFYHFGSVDELLAAACRYGAEKSVAAHRARLAEVTSLSELLAVGREIHERERAHGHVALLGQLLAGAPHTPRSAPPRQRASTCGSRRSRRSCAGSCPAPHWASSRTPPAWHAPSPRRSWASSCTSRWTRTGRVRHWTHWSNWGGAGGGTGGTGPGRAAGSAQALAAGVGGVRGRGGAAEGHA
ncbi:hypothetical protein GCM10020256_22460 [Streptomyces thermocoprophilus]